MRIVIKGESSQLESAMNGLVAKILSEDTPPQVVFERAVRIAAVNDVAVGYVYGFVWGRLVLLARNGEARHASLFADRRH